jgi:hypothetical protein
MVMTPDVVTTVINRMLVAWRFPVSIWIRTLKLLR